MLNVRFMGCHQNTTYFLAFTNFYTRLLGGDNFPLSLNGKMRFPDILVHSSIIDSCFKWKKRVLIE